MINKIIFLPFFFLFTNVYSQIEITCKLTNRNPNGNTFDKDSNEVLYCATFEFTNITSHPFKYWTQYGIPTNFCFDSTIRMPLGLDILDRGQVIKMKANNTVTWENIPILIKASGLEQQNNYTGYYIVVAPKERKK
jgi:hypothetical protein